MGSTDEEMQTGLLGGELGALAQIQAEAAQPPTHHRLQLSPSQHTHSAGQLSFNTPSGSDIRWLSFV